MNRQLHIKWTDYMKYRAKTRQFHLDKLEEIVRYSSERYFDLATARSIVIGRHEKKLVIIAYEVEKETYIPVTVHTTTRQQINYRRTIGRFIHG